MARLIDADEAKLTANDYGMFRCQLGGLVDVVEFLNDMPTVDAVPVVRCRDCRHWHKDTVSCGYMSYGEASERVNWYADDFCSYGERKDGDDNG